MSEVVRTWKLSELARDTYKLERSEIRTYQNTEKES